MQEVDFSLSNDTINFKEKQNIENVIDFQQKLINEKKKGYTEYTLEYKLKDGKKITRKYAINNTLYKEELKRILTSDEYYDGKIRQIQDAKKIKRITININYKEQYSTKAITVKDEDKEEFLENIIEDIKNRKATINDNEYVSEIARASDKIRSIYVRIELKEGKTKTIKYNNFKDINIENYIR